MCRRHTSGGMVFSVGDSVVVVVEDCISSLCFGLLSHEKKNCFLAWVALSDLQGTVELQIILFEKLYDSQFN